MSKIKLLSAIAGAALSFIGFAQAYAANPSLWVYNVTPHPIWITVYGKSSNGDKLDYFCVMPGQDSPSNNGTYASLSNVYLRAEVKKETGHADCSDHSNKWDIHATLVSLVHTSRAMNTYAAPDANSYPSVNVTAWF